MALRRLFSWGWYWTAEMCKAAAPLYDGPLYLNDLCHGMITLSSVASFVSQDSGSSMKFKFGENQGTKKLHFPKIEWSFGRKSDDWGDHFDIKWTFRLDIFLVCSLTFLERCCIIRVSGIGPGQWWRIVNSGPGLCNSSSLHSPFG